jgi:hypothetical protein
MLYTKNGSIPSELPEGITAEQHIAAGWLPVMQPKPSEVEGKEVVWLNWSWVKRDLKPEASDGYVYKWNHDRHEWVEYSVLESVVTEQIQALTSSQIQVLSTTQIGL